MNRLALLPTLASLFALAACNSSTEGVDPGPVTQEEAEALDDAASMLDEGRLLPDPADAPQDETSPDTGDSE